MSANGEAKVVVVTGGAQGIGQAIAEAFARAGARVWIADVDAEASEETGNAFQAKGHRVRVKQCDVGEEQQIAALFDAVATQDGHVDCLVNNAGIGWIGDFDTRTTADWERVLAVNLRGPYLCAKHGVPHMPEGSAIVNIASTRALMSEPNTESYAASKAGLVGLTHALAVTLGERGIRVNAISPGWIDVSTRKKSPAGKPTALSSRDHGQHPVGRVGIPEDIAEICLFLADPARAGFITGQNFVVDGGMTKKMLYLE